MRKSFGVVAVLMLALAVGLTTVATAGAGGQGATAAKKKKKKCPAGTVKQVIKKKNGKKKKRCVPVQAATPTPPSAKLAINPGAQDFGTAQHNNPCPSVDCPERVFTVSNSGGASSGSLSASIALVKDPAGQPNPPAFVILSNGCSAVPPGGNCSITVGFNPDDNPGGDNQYISTLNVSGSPGGAAQATLTGNSS